MGGEVIEVGRGCEGGGVAAGVVESPAEGMADKGDALPLVLGFGIRELSGGRHCEHPFGLKGLGEGATTVHLGVELSNRAILAVSIAEV